MTTEKTTLQQHRRTAREMTLKKLFEKEFNEQQTTKDQTSSHSQSQEYSHQLLQGVHQKQNNIDELIQKTSQSWKLDRMSLIDLNIMRIAVYEMLYSTPLVPFKVCINEAIEIAKIYGTKDSVSFINGILDPISNQLQQTQKDNSVS